jgi:hypothetical protein
VSPDETNENKTIRKNGTTKMFFIVKRFFFLRPKQKLEQNCFCFCALAAKVPLQELELLHLCPKD